MIDDIWSKIRISQAPAEAAASASRGFTTAELALARRLHSRGQTWKQIARALGRRSGDGIKRRLDPAYREHRNAYRAAYTYAERQRAKAPLTEERRDASLDEIAERLRELQMKRS